MDDRIIIKFKNSRAETNGFDLLCKLRRPFGYRDYLRYAVSKEQLNLLEQQKIEFSIRE